MVQDDKRFIFLLFLDEKKHTYAVGAATHWALLRRGRTYAVGVQFLTGFRVSKNYYASGGIPVYFSTMKSSKNHRLHTNHAKNKFPY